MCSRAVSRSEAARLRIRRARWRYSTDIIADEMQMLGDNPGSEGGGGGERPMRSNNPPQRSANPPSRPAQDQGFEDDDFPF